MVRWRCTELFNLIRTAIFLQQSNHWFDCCKNLVVNIGVMTPKFNHTLLFRCHTALVLCLKKEFLMKLSLFRNRNFCLLVIGYSTSLFGTVFLNTALSLYILNLTGSATKFSLVLSLGIIPQVLLGLFAGVFVDRVDRRKTILFLDLVRGLYLLVLFAYSIIHPLGEWAIYATVFLFGICDLFFTPAFVTLLPSIVKKEELVEGNSLQTTITEATKTLAPVLAGIVFSMSGIGIIMLIDGLTFLISVVTTYLMVFSKSVVKAERFTLYEDIKIGVGSVFKRDVRVVSLVLNGVLTHIFLHSFILVGVPYLLINVFKGTDIQFGTVQTMMTAGSICAVLVVMFIKERFNTSQSIGLGIIGMTVAILPYLALGNNHFSQLLSANHLLPVTFFSIINFAIYLAYNTYTVFFIAFYQNIIPTEMLGRYLSISSLLYAIGRLIGFKMYGFLLDHTSLVFSILILGLGMVLKLLVHLPFMKYERQVKLLTKVE